MELQPKLVEKLAALARLELTPDEVARFHQQLPTILDYVGQLQEVSTSTSVATVEPNELRSDVAAPSTAGPRILDQAPERSGEFWKVDAVFS